MKHTSIRPGEREKAEERPRTILPADMLALVSHEMRTPLTAITGYATLLLRYAPRLTAEECQEFHQTILSAGKRLERVVDLLMELTAVETLTHLASPLPVNLMGLIEEAVIALPQELHLSPGGEERIVLPSSVLRNGQGEEAWVVPGDQTFLRHLLDHLLDNALRFSAPERSVTIGLCRHQAQDVQHHLALGEARKDWYVPVPPPAWPASTPLVEIQMEDQGPGMAPEHLSTIFKPFAQAEQQLTREHEGLGLGLAICKRIVELHQGMLLVESTPGVGSTFHIVLPAIDIP